MRAEYGTVIARPPLELDGPLVVVVVVVVEGLLELEPRPNSRVESLVRKAQGGAGESEVSGGVHGGGERRGEVHVWGAAV
jgi:hypothetical protein